MLRLLSYLTVLLLLSYRAEATVALPPTAVLLNRAGSDQLWLYYHNIYMGQKDAAVRPKGTFTVTFDENAYTPTLVQITTRLPSPKDSLYNGQFLEQPVLPLLPGDSVWVTYNQRRNTFAFKGCHQAELDFYQKVWKGELSLSGLYFEMNVPASRVPLDQFLQHWSKLKQEGEALIATLGHTPGIRPSVAAFLARHIRLRVFSILLLPADYQRPRDSLRVLTAAYNDSVAANAHLLREFQHLPATATDGLGRALTAYAAYRCVQQGHYPALGNKYAQAKHEYNGFRRAWACFLILEGGRRNHKNISRLLKDYQGWVHPHDEFVRVLKGDPTVPLRSYKGAVFTDQLTDAADHPQRLADLLDAHKGNVVLLDLWASWCAPCLAELPASAAAGRRYKSKGLVVVYLSIDKEPQKWQQALKRLPKDGRHFRFADTETAAFLREFEVTSIPRYVLIDRNGAVRYPDALRPSDPRFKAVLEKLLLL